MSRFARPNSPQYIKHLQFKYSQDRMAEKIGLAANPVIGDLRGAAGRSLTPLDFSSLFSFARNSIACSVDTSGFVKGFAANIIQQSVKGWRLEGGVINRTDRSDEPENASWARTAISNVATNAQLGPDNLTFGRKIIEDATNAQHYLSRSFTASIVADNSDYIVAAVVKQADAARSYFGILTIDKASVQARTYFNISTGTIGTNGAGNTAFIEPLPNGWYLCSVRRNAGSGAAANINPRFYSGLTADNVSSFQGDGASGIYLWRGGIFNGSIPSIPPQTTTAANIARASDELPLKPAIFTEIFKGNLSTGYFVGEINLLPLGGASDRIIFSCDDGSGSNAIRLVCNSAGNIIAQSIKAGVVTATASAGNIVPGTTQRVGLIWRQGLLSAVLDGGTVQNAAPENETALTACRFGSDYAASLNMYGHFSKIYVGSHALNRSALQAATVANSEIDRILRQG